MGRVIDALDPGPAKCLVVFLPGAGDDAQTFERHGFVAALRSRGLSADAVSAYATMGYYFKGTFSDRLAADVVEPARSRGYAQTWLVGISMGGLGTLWYAKEHPGQVHGVLALAPFLGSSELGEEIRAAGGLATWRAPEPEPMNGDNYQRQIWRWLQAITSGREPGPSLYVGWGDKDGLGTVDAILGDALPADHVLRVPGGHAWSAWKPIFDRFLDGPATAQACRPPAPKEP